MLSLTYLIVAVGKAVDIKSVLIKTLEEHAVSGWSDCLDKRQVWNQKRTPWLEAIMHFVYPVLDCVVEMLINAVENGASMYQAMSLALTCVSEIWDCMPEGLYKITALLQDIIPVSTRPLGDSVLLQVVFAALYTELIKTAELQEQGELVVWIGKDSFILLFSSCSQQRGQGSRLLLSVRGHLLH